MQCCRQYGMVMPICADSNQIQNTPNSIEETISVCKKEGCEFVMFITEDKITNLHSINI